MDEIILSHEIKEQWNLYPNGFEGAFFTDKHSLGKIGIYYEFDELRIHTCHFYVFHRGQKIGQEIAARAMLFGKELAQERDIQAYQAYKFYTLSALEQEEERNGKKFNFEPYNALFKRLGFKPCPLHDHKPDTLLSSPRDPMSANLGEVVENLGNNWGNLFYKRRAQALNIGWDFYQQNLCWDEHEAEWFHNYKASREGVLMDPPTMMPVNLRTE